MINQAVILCGGLGTRLLPITKKIPKPMVMINNKPFLEHLIIQCKENGIQNFLLLCGYKKELIQKYFKNGEKLGVKIKYHFNASNIKTFKRLLDAKKLLNKKFLLLYGDNYSSLNLFDLKKNYKKLNAPIMLTLCVKNPGNISISKETNLITNYFLEKKKSSNYVEIGYMIFQKQILDEFNKNKNKNISLSYLLKSYVKENKISYYLNDTNYLSISDPKRLNITKKHFSNRVILLDRDGVMNKKNYNHRYVRNLNELKINYKIIKKYFKILKDKKIICITNQAGIATGDVKNHNLNKINKKITQEYKKKGLNVIKFYISKHHFNSKHDDRKPRHGLFLKAASKNKFVLDKTLYIGDDLRDIEAAYNAKTKCIYVGYERIPEKFYKKYTHTLIKKYG
jgi:histidinol-phosphate phosphatase family protein